jgi:hypothetical protein
VLCSSESMLQVESLRQHALPPITARTGLLQDSNVICNGSDHGRRERERVNGGISYSGVCVCVSVCVCWFQSGFGE